MTMINQLDRLEHKLDTLVESQHRMGLSVARLETTIPPIHKRLDDIESELLDVDSDVSGLKGTQDQAQGAVRFLGWLGGASFLFAIVVAILAWARGH